MLDTRGTKDANILSMVGEKDMQTNNYNAMWKLVLLELSVKCDENINGVEVDSGKIREVVN